MNGISFDRLTEFGFYFQFLYLCSVIIKNPERLATYIGVEKSL